VWGGESVKIQGPHDEQNTKTKKKHKTHQKTNKQNTQKKKQREKSAKTSGHGVKAKVREVF